MRFYKNNYCILHLAQSNSAKSINPDGSGRRAALEERSVGADSRLNVSQQRALAGKRANILRCNISSWSKKVIILLCWAWAQPQFQCCVKIWVPEFKMDAKVFECIQKRATEVVKRMEGMSCKDQVRTLACLIWRAGRSRGISLLLTASWGGKGEGSTDVFSLISSDRLCESGLNLHHGRFRHNLRKHFFTKTVVNILTGFLERSGFHACQCLRGIWKTLLITCFNFQSAWTGQAGGLVKHYGSFHWVILLYYWLGLCMVGTSCMELRSEIMVYSV